MIRTIAGVILGYLAMAVLLAITFTAVYLVIGVDRAFRPGGFDVSPTWMVISVVVGFGAAFAGGLVARALGRSPTAPRALAGVVLLLGFVLAVSAMVGGMASPGVRAGDLGAFEAMQHAQTPLWMMFINPVVGALGVLLGGGALGRSGEEPRAGGPVRTTGAGPGAAPTDVT